MALVVRAFPVRDREAVIAFADEVRARAEEARRFYTSLGVRREAWYFQQTDHCPMILGITDIEEPIEEKAHRYANASDPYSVWFKSKIEEISRIDPNTMPLGPRTDLIYDSSGLELPEGIPLSVRAYPVRSRAAVDEFVGELSRRDYEKSRFYGAFGVHRETWHFQQTDHGPIVIAVAAAEGLEDGARAFAASQDPFSVWFKKRVVEVSGVNPNETPLGPETELVFEFRA